MTASSPSKATPRGPRTRVEAQCHGNAFDSPPARAGGTVLLSSATVFRALTAERHDLPKTARGRAHSRLTRTRRCAMRDRITFTPQHYREKAKSLRELALQTSDPQERRELLVVSNEMATLGA